MNYHKVAGVDLDVNTIPCSGLSTTSLLHNNYVSATSVFFELTRTVTNLDISVICAPEHCQFMLTDRHVVVPVLPIYCDVKCFVRIS